MAGLSLVQQIRIRLSTLSPCLRSRLSSSFSSCTAQSASDGPKSPLQAVLMIRFGTMCTTRSVNRSMRPPRSPVDCSTNNTRLARVLVKWRLSVQGCAPKPLHLVPVPRQITSLDNFAGSTPGCSKSRIPWQFADVRLTLNATGTGAESSTKLEGTALIASIGLSAS